MASFGVPLFCLLECLMIGWVYGRFQACDDFYDKRVISKYANIKGLDKSMQSIN